MKVKKGLWRIQYIAERPTVANNFGYQLRGNGLEDMLRVFYSPDEASVVEVCERRGVRYLFLNDMFLVTGPLTKLIGIDYEKAFFGDRFPHAEAELFYPSGAFKALPYARMYYMDGSASASGGAVTRFRQIFESEHLLGLFHANSWTKEVKIFEFVKGARIEGRARPGQRVVLSCRMMTNFDRVFFPEIGESVLAHCIATYQQLGCWTPHVEITRAAYEKTLDVFEYNGLLKRRYRYEEVCTAPPAAD